MRRIERKGRMTTIFNCVYEYAFNGYCLIIAWNGWNQSKHERKHQWCALPSSATFPGLSSFLEKCLEIGRTIGFIIFHHYRSFHKDYVIMTQYSYYYSTAIDRVIRRRGTAILLQGPPRS